MPLLVDQVHTILHKEYKIEFKIEFKILSNFTQHSMNGIYVTVSDFNQTLS